MKPYQLKVEKPWGYELIFTPPESPVAGKLLHLNAGARFSLQYHEVKEETLVLIKGEVKLILGGMARLDRLSANRARQGEIREEEMAINNGYFIPKGQVHRCEAITDCDILEASTKEEGTTIRLEDDYSRGDEIEEERLNERKS